MSQPSQKPSTPGQACDNVAYIDKSINDQTPHTTKPQKCDERRTNTHRCNKVATNKIVMQKQNRRQYKQVSEDHLEWGGRWVVEASAFTWGRQLAREGVVDQGVEWDVIACGWKEEEWVKWEKEGGGGEGCTANELDMIIEKYSGEYE
jgi:hypothetical protein